MLRTLSLTLLGVGLLSLLAHAQPIQVPENLAADLNPNDGTVALTWDYDLGGGYFNDFDTNDLTGWEIDNPAHWTIDTDNGILHTEWTPEAAWQWSSMAYTAETYTNATLTARMRRTAGATNYAQSIFIHGAGPFEPPAWSGFMVQIEVQPTSQFTVIRVIEGDTEFVTPGWEPSVLLNDGLFAWNELSVEVVDGVFTLSINGGEVYTWQDQTLLSGTVSIGGVGPVGEFQAMDFDYVSFQPAAALDDFQHFNVYRDEELIGTTTSTEYTDDLPGFGWYDYTVTAQWDEGESEPSNTASADFNNPMFYLVPPTLTIPSAGGTLVYDGYADLPNPSPIGNVRYSTSVELPNGDTYPLSSINTALPPFFHRALPGQQQEVPAFAPDGRYEFIAVLRQIGGPSISDRFAFSKGDPAAISTTGNGEADWPKQVLNFGGLASKSGVEFELPGEFSLEPVYPNPFNAQATVTVRLPHEGDLSVVVLNTLGRRVANLASGPLGAGEHLYTLDASTLASGIYFVLAETGGQALTRKVVVMK